MPASAVANLTPAISGIEGTSVGASGEMVEDMGKIRQTIAQMAGHGRISPGHPRLVARARLKTSMARTARAKMRFAPAMTFVNTTHCEEVTAIFTSSPA